VTNHSQSCGARLLHQAKGTSPEVSSIKRMCFCNCKWAVHVASGNFFINEVSDIFGLDFHRREIVRDKVYSMGGGLPIGEPEERSWMRLG